MHGMRISHIGSDTPLAVAPLPAWGIRQAATREGGSSQAALLTTPTVVGNLLIGIGFYRRGANTMGPVAWAEASGHSWHLLSFRITNEGSPNFERGIFLYALAVTNSNQRTIRFTTGHDCDDVDPGDIGAECDIMRATLVELVPPVGHTYEDVSFLNVNQRTTGDNGATVDGLQVSSDSWAIPDPIGTLYLMVSVCGWRVAGAGPSESPMANLVWTPDLSKGNIYATAVNHGISLHLGVHLGDETIILQGNFATGKNSGLSMAACAIEFG